MTNENQTSFSGWARVEVMGHQTHIGYVRTESYGGAVLFRVDTPGADEREYILEAPEYASSKWCLAGTVVKRPARPPVTVMIGAGSIYRMVPCDEAAALKAIEREQRAELILVRLPEGKAIAASEVAEDDVPFDDTEDDDGPCEDCGRPMEECSC